MSWTDEPFALVSCNVHFSSAFRFSLMVCLSKSLAAFETGDYLWLRMIIFRICQPLLVCQCAQSKCWFLVIPQIIYDKWPQYLIFWLLLLDFLISKCEYGKGLIFLLVVELFLAFQIGMCTLCLVNLHCVEFWSEAISKQPDAVLYKIGKTESQISILRSAPQIYFHIFQSPLPAIF